MTIKYKCLACNGTGKKGYIKGFVFTCPYCMGRKYFKTVKEQRSAGLRCGAIVNTAYQTTLI